MSDVLLTILWAMTPIGELRLAIPLAMHEQDMPWHQAYLWGVVGNMVPTLILLWGFKVFSRLVLSRPNPIGRLLMWRAERLRRTQMKWVERWGPWALTPFVAIPLPITGAWTACLAAWALDVPARKAVAPIFVGVVVAGGIVTTIAQFSINFPFIEN